MQQEERFGAELKALRVKAGWSQRRAAQAIGISPYRLDELERGLSRSTGHATRPSRETVLRLAAAYKVPSDHLLRLAGHAPEHPPDLADEDLLLLDAFHGLSKRDRALALRLVQAIRG